MDLFREIGFCEGDVVSGSSSGGVHHPGLLESWFGEHWWTGRFLVLVVVTLGVFTPLAFLKRIGVSCDLCFLSKKR